jgi:hypothetical protein
VSPESAKAYDLLPTWAGVKQLIADGTLLEPDAQRFKASYEKWDAAISQPFRNSLDPNFRFSHKIDYLIAKATQLPAGFNGFALLVDESIDTPVTKGAGFQTCLFFADHRLLQIDRTREPDPSCYVNAIWLQDRERKLLTMRDALERIKGYDQGQTEGCSVSSIPDNAHFAGIAVSEGPAWRPAANDPSRRQINVIVQRPGRVALYLEIWGGRTDWHILPAPETEVVAVFFASPPPVRDAVQVEGTNSAVVQPLSSRPGVPCQYFGLSRYAHVGGPAAMHLDASLKVLVGRGLDQLIRETNSGNWSPVDGLGKGPRVSFVVE